MIRLTDVRKRLGGREVLSGVNLTVEKGETMAIIGYSGTGKSVTIKNITGLMSPDGGTIELFGRDVTHYSPRQYAEVRKRIGLLFQSGALLAWMTVFENVALPLREHTKMTEDQVRARVMEKLALVSLQDAGHKYPAEISGGMKKRAGLARAIVLEPDIVLYDEPTSGLDPVMSNAINELVLDMQKALGVTQVVVTHDMNSAYMIGNHIAMLYGGKIEQAGTPDDIRRSTNPIVRQFINGETAGPHAVR
ncbi:MAG: ABC transporter ATP-binding protein [Planctomycetes bacterium]|nr:ABC transporter ATP-binding protein [Planctomycetota bacterium]